MGSKAYSESQFKLFTRILGVLRRLRLVLRRLRLHGQFCQAQTWPEIDFESSGLARAQNFWACFTSRAQNNLTSLSCTLWIWQHFALNFRSHMSQPNLMSHKEEMISNEKRTDHNFIVKLFSLDGSTTSSRRFFLRRGRRARARHLGAFELDREARRRREAQRVEQRPALRPRDFRFQFRIHWTWRNNQKFEKVDVGHKPNKQIRVV